MRTLLFLLICCSFAAIHPVQAQQVETMHIHFDKDSYLPGEMIWFKCYTYFNNKPSALSSNLFIGFYDQNGILLAEKRYPLIEGTTNGDFKIAADSGYTALVVKAFTKAMWLQDSTHLYERTLTIRTTPDSLTNIEPPTATTSLQFFPEGGQWVAGLYSYLAFKVWHNDGSPAIAHGKIVDSNGQTVVDSFVTNEMGLGKLQLLPKKGTTYKASWQDAEGRQHETLLPQVKELGATLHTELADKNVFYSVLKNTDASNFDTLHLRASVHNIIIYEAALPMKGLSQAVNKFTTDSVPVGLLLVTLTDSRWNPLQEKLVYIKHEDAAANDPIINFTQTSTASKGKNEISIVVPDTLFTNMSLSIADASFFSHDQPGIKDELLVAGELKGLWPGLALKPLMQQYPELVTATHGWRKYDWPLAPGTGAIRQVDNYITLGVAYKEKNYALKQNAQLTLMIKDPQTGNQFYKLPQQTQTSYSTDGLVFYDSAKIYYQVEGYPETMPYLKLVSDAHAMQEHLTVHNKIAAGRLVLPSGTDAISSTAGPDFDWINNTPTDTGNVKTKTLKEVKFNARMVNPVTRRLQEMEDKYATGLFRGTSKGYQINVLDDPNAETSIDIYSYVFGKVPGIRVAAGMGGRSLQAIDHFENDPFRAWKDVMVFIDEVQWEPSGLGNINMNNVAYIKFIPGLVIQSVGNGRVGALYVYSKRGDETSGSGSNMKTNIIKGYSIAKQFFNPAYDTESSKTKQDLRTTLYWEPYVITDKTNHKVNIVFYNNDVSKKLLLTLKGFNEEGKLIEIQKIIE